MNNKSFNFAWKTFQTHIAQSLQDLVTEGNFADVTLVSDEQIQIPAHKIVLSACSPVLKNLLLNNPHSHPLLYIRGVKQQELQSILQFMYLGEATINIDHINEFMEIAKDLKLKEFMNDNSLKYNIDDVKGELENPKYLADSIESYLYSEPEQNNIEVDIEEHASLIDDAAKFDDNTSASSSSIPENTNLDTEEQIDIKEKNEVSMEKVFKCQNCDSVYKSKNYLRSHQQTKHEGRYFPCNQCDFKSQFRENVSKHKKSKHEGVKFVCDECDHHFITKQSLVTHQQSKHEGFRYSCDKCDYEATQQGALNNHKMSKHEGVRYSCNQCEYQAVWKSHLYSHKQRVHGRAKATFSNINKENT